MIEFTRASKPCPKSPIAARPPLNLAALRGGCIGLACLGLSGCALRGAPSYSIFGAYFPAWLLCAGFGIFGSILLRSLLIVTDLEEAVPLKLLVYCAFALGLSLWLWLALFGES